MHPDCAPDLRTHLAARDARVLTPGGCRLELVLDAVRRPRELHAIVSWELAVPLKVERLGQALVAAGGVLRRELDADLVRLTAAAAGHRLIHVGSVRDLDLLSPSRFAPGASPIGLPALRSAAA